MVFLFRIFISAKSGIFWVSKDFAIHSSFFLLGDIPSCMYPFIYPSYHSHFTFICYCLAITLIWVVVSNHSFISLLLEPPCLLLASATLLSLYRLLTLFLESVSSYFAGCPDNSEVITVPHIVRPESGGLPVDYQRTTTGKLYENSYNFPVAVRWLFGGCLTGQLVQWTFQWTVQWTGTGHMHEKGKN